jgi:ABC-type transport system involved in multi-copper enzyme maturation permease subunit
MTPVVLLARSFIRQNRWLLLAFVFWPFLLGAFVWSPHHRAAANEVVEIIQQEVFYGVAVATFLISSAIYNEKRSRRIIGVLSKAVSRTQYLLGLVLGCGCFASVYFVAVCGSMMWLAGVSDSSVSISLALLLHSLIASLWMASLALLFSTFLYPFIAAAFAGAIGFAPFALSRMNLALTPMPVLLENIGTSAATANWEACAIALFESVLFLLMAAYIFSLRDLTVSIE